MFFFIRKEVDAKEGNTVGWSHRLRYDAADHEFSPETFLSPDLSSSGFKAHTVLKPNLGLNLGLKFLPKVVARNLSPGLKFKP